jgi:hypothetical protein
VLRIWANQIKKLRTNHTEPDKIDLVG